MAELITALFGFFTNLAICVAFIRRNTNEEKDEEESKT